VLAASSIQFQDIVTGNCVTHWTLNSCGHIRHDCAFLLIARSFQHNLMCLYGPVVSEKLVGKPVVDQVLHKPVLTLRDLRLWSSIHSPCNHHDMASVCTLWTHGNSERHSPPTTILEMRLMYTGECIISAPCARMLKWHIRCHSYMSIGHMNLLKGIHLKRSICLEVVQWCHQ